MGRRIWWWALVVAAGLASVALFTPLDARAVFPGVNGLIAFDAPSGPQIRTINPDGTGKTTLTSEVGGATEPAWSPDGTKVAFVNGVGHIAVMDANGQNVQDLTPGDPQGGTVDEFPAFSRDGSKIYFSRIDFNSPTPEYDIWVMNAGDGSHQVNLTPHLGINSRDPVVSPDGSTVAFVRGNPTAIWTMGTDGSNPAQLTPGADFDDSRPSWSPDGSKLIYTQNLGGSNSDLWQINSNGTGEKQLTKTAGREEDSASWSPDASKIVTSATTISSGGVHLYLVDPSSGSETVIANTSGAADPDWQAQSPPQSLTVIRGGGGSGTVTSAPAGINCGITCSHTFAAGTQVTLTATPASGSVFTGWAGGGCSGTGTCTVSVAAAVTVTATFSLSARTLTVSSAGTGSGTVTSSPAGISCPSTCAHAFADGTPVTLTATPASSSTFSGWSGACAGKGTCQLTLRSSQSATATFNRVAPHGKYTGTVLSCNYAADADTVNRAFTATIGGCTKPGDPRGTLQGSWTDPPDEGSSASLDEAELSIDGRTIDFAPGYTVNLPATIESNPAAAFDRIVKQFALDMIIEAASAAEAQFGSGVESELAPFNQVEDGLIKWCAAQDGEPRKKDPVYNSCVPGADLNPPPHPPPVRHYNPNNPVLDNGDHADSNGDDQTMCPVLLGGSHGGKAIYVCIPVFVTGNLNTGKKPLIIMPGGALFMIPTPGSGQPTISSKQAVIMLGGAIIGGDVTIKAPDIALALGFVNGIDALHLNGKRISIGSVDGGSLLSKITGLPLTWATHVLFPHLHATISGPETISAPLVKVTADRSLNLDANSRIDVTGHGSHGADFDTGFNPTGESSYYGGSHGGLGGMPTLGIGGQYYDMWYTKQGRSPSFDSPFAPDRPGDGGGGEPTGALGQPGGGVIRIDARKGKATIDGQLSAAGFGTGDPAGNGDHGGSGGGGSIYLTVNKLGGGGDINADGGSYCLACDNGGGGGGGGGRIAVLWTSHSGWHGRMHAFGGRDEHYNGPPPHEPADTEFLGSGGAGTVFTRSVKFSAKGNPQPAKHSKFPDGALTVDGGRAAGDYPPPDGTPLRSAWNDAKRQLIITGEARAYATKLHYKEIDLSHGATLTPGIDGTNHPIPSTLAIQAVKLSVASRSLVTVTGRGLRGGSSQSSSAPGGAVKGATSSTGAHGGSHGGAGGGSQVNGARTGSTYDSKRHPSQPGGGGGGAFLSAEGNPGGGVLDIQVGALILNGVVAADGESADGPTPSEPAPHDFNGGAGAGGSVYVKAGTLSGHGQITALGGTACAASHPPLLPGVDGCGEPSGGGGGGGGGRVAVIAAPCHWRGSLKATGGRDLQAEASGDKKYAKLLRGAAGTTYFHKKTPRRC